MASRAAAEISLEFAEPPALRRGSTKPVRATGKKRALRLVPADYVAPDSHRPHGSYVKYVVELCRCPDCRKANRDYETRRQHAMHRPDEVWMPYVPAGPARRHVEALKAQGVGPKTIAKLSGVAHGSLARLIYGDPKRGTPPSKGLRPATAAAILAVRVDRASGGQKIDARPTWQLLNDLMARGFTKRWIAAQLLPGSTSANPSLQIKPDLVRASTARAVEALHARLRGVEAPPRKSRWSA